MNLTQKIGTNGIIKIRKGLILYLTNEIFGTK